MRQTVAAAMHRCKTSLRPPSWSNPADCGILVRTKHIAEKDIEMSALHDTLSRNNFFKTGAFIHGKWITTGKTFADTNPSTGEKLADIAFSGREETEAAIISAKTAFATWRKTTATERADILYRWYELMVANRQFLGELMTAEQGKPLAEALGEVDYAASFIRWFAEEARRANGEIIPPFKPNSRIFATREPVGVVAAITPWNFPMAMLARKLGPALAAGCTAIIKPADETPLCANALLALADAAGVPPGVLNGVCGDTLAISDAIMASPDVRKITFTGSTAVGKLLMQNAAGTMKRISMELGGNAPLIVFDDADIDAAVAGTVANKFRNAGQVCVAINRIYVQDRIYDEYVGKLAKAIGELTVGDGFAPGVTVGPLIRESAVEKVERHVQDALAKEAELVTGGHRSALGGTFYEPTLLSHCTDDMLIASEETFGPVAACFRFETEQEAINRANNTPFGLAAYFYTKDLSRVFRVSEALEAGMIGINDTGVSSAVAPFGGVKESGIGREGSVLGLEEYLDVKTLHLGNLG